MAAGVRDGDRRGREEVTTMEWVGSLMAAAVVLVLVGPMALLVLGMLAWTLAGLFLLPAGPTVIRTTFACPFSRRAVTADFLTPPGEERPVDVLSCTAFRDPRAIRCKKGCLALATLHAVSAPMLPRWSLVAGGVAYRR
jgi:hypothetical protein